MVKLVGDPTPSTIVDPSKQYTIVVEEGPEGDRGPQGEKGDKGDPGTGGGKPYEYTMPASQTTAVIDHPLGYDPISIQVIDLDGTVYTDFQIVYTIPLAQVTLGWNTPIRARIRLV